MTQRVHTGAAGRLLIDMHCRLQGHCNVYAIGDCAICDENPLPPIAQAAQQQANYVAEMLNKYSKFACVHARLHACKCIYRLLYSKQTMLPIF